MVGVRFRVRSGSGYGLEKVKSGLGSGLGISFRVWVVYSLGYEIGLVSEG